MVRPVWALTRITFLFLLCFAVTFLLFICLYSERNVGSHFHNIYRWIRPKLGWRRGYLVDTSGCQMPEIDPFHPSVKPFYKKMTSYSCQRPPAPIKIRHNIVTLDTYAVQHFYNGSWPKCQYKWIRRAGHPIHDPTDNKVFISPRWLELRLGVPIMEDAVQIRCLFPHQRVFENYAPLVYLKPKVEERCSQNERTVKNGDLRMNVLFLGVDSISKLNFQRHMTKTREILRDLSFVELSGYSKVADNTFPNMYPLLVGEPAVYLPTKTRKFYDDTDLIWKRYSRLGYRTLFVEDFPKYTIFNFLKNGFKKPPTDYYLRPFSLTVERSKWFKKSRRYCFGERMETRVYYDYTLDFIDVLKNRPFFAFVFMARMTHNNVNSAGYADDPSYEMLNELNRRNVLNNTLVFFFSDHGIRFGPIRNTYVGKLEENWPIMFVGVPDWFRLKYPDFMDNLRLNRHRLTTPYDIHETLTQHLDLLNGTNGTIAGNQRKKYGSTLFGEIPESRTCEQVGISNHWCNCQMLQRVLPNDTLVKEASLRLVKILNSWLVDSPGCETLYLSRVIEARMALMANSRKLPAVSEPEVLVRLDLKPAGLFESTLRRVKGNWTVLGGVSRLDSYDGQSDCIDNSELKKFCLCKTIT